jgi:hypothetical protein
MVPSLLAMAFAEWRTGRGAVPSGQRDLEERQDLVRIET